MIGITTRVKDRVVARPPSLPEAAGPVALPRFVPPGRPPTGATRALCTDHFQRTHSMSTLPRSLPRLSTPSWIVACSCMLRSASAATVSYTHLTLPTIYSV